MKQNQIVAFSEFDSNRILYDRSQIEQVNPHRFELSLLDGILYEDCQRWRFVGFADAKASDFWTRGHFPGQPLMPGVLICEVAAQLCSFMAIRHGQRTSSLMGLAGLDKVRFRRPVAPGDRLIMMIEQIRFRANALIQIRFQGFVKQELATEGTLKGAVLSPQSTSAEIAGATVFRD